METAESDLLLGCDESAILARDLDEEDSRSSSWEESSDGFEIGSDDVAKNIKLLEEFVAGGDENQNEAPDDVAQNVKLLEEFVASADENQNEADGNKDQAKNIKLTGGVVAMAGKSLETRISNSDGDDLKEGGAASEESAKVVAFQNQDDGAVGSQEADANGSIRSRRLMRSGSGCEWSRQRRKSSSRSASRYRDSIQGGSQRRRKRNCSRTRSRSWSKTRRRSRSRSRGGNGGRRSMEKPKVCKVLGAFGLNKKLTTEKNLWGLFGKYGHVEKVVLPCRWGENKGFGFITFSSEAEATRARDSLNGAVVDHSKIRVDYSLTTRAHSPTPGQYYGRPDQSSWRPASRHRQHLNRERPRQERSGHRESRSRRPSKRSSSRESSRRSRSCRMSRMRSRSSSSTHSRRKPTSRSTSPSPPWERAGLVREASRIMEPSWEREEIARRNQELLLSRIEDRRPRRSLQIASRRCEGATATGPEVGNCSKSSAMWRSPTSIRGYPSSVKRSPSPLSSKYSSSPSSLNRSSSPSGPMERCSSPSDPYQRSSSPSSPIKRPSPSEEESQSQHLSPKSSPILTKKPPEKALAFGGDMKKRKEIEESPVKLSLTKCAPLSTHSGSPASSTLAPWSPLRGTSGNPSSPSLLSSWAVPLSPFQKKYFQARNPSPVWSPSHSPGADVAARNPSRPPTPPSPWEEN